MVVRWLAFFLSAYVLIGCATTEKYEAILGSWVGASEPELIRSWGIPASVYEASETEKYLTYRRSGAVTVPGVAPTYQTTFYGNTAYTTSYGGTPPTTVQLHCETTFTVRNGMIVNWRWSGNNCVAK